MASATENPSKQFIESLDKLEVPKASNTYNITGKSAAQVIAILKSMVNRKGKLFGYRHGKEFTFNICRDDQPKISFQFKEVVYEDQPGNGFIWRKDPNNLNKRIIYSYNETLVNKLEEQYSNNTEKFAQDIKRVFKNNSELLQGENEIIKDVYFVLLFEIGRRLVKDDPESTLRKKEFDNLRISEAITKIVKLFDNEACRFEDVFIKGKKFHCFSGEPKTRQDAISHLLTQLEELKLEDLKELFHVEEDKKSPEDTTSRDEKSSKDAASQGKESSDDAEVRELSRVLSNRLRLEVSPQKESKKPSNKD